MILKLEQQFGESKRVERFRRPRGSNGRKITPADVERARSVAKSRPGFVSGYADLRLIGAKPLRAIKAGDNPDLIFEVAAETVIL